MISLYTDDSFKLGSAGTTTCPQGYRVVEDLARCKSDVTAWNGKEEFGIEGCYKFGAGGCLFSTKDSKVSFSTCESTGTAAWHTPICEQGKKFIF